jgi:hypothetical protein
MTCGSLWRIGAYRPASQIERGLKLAGYCYGERTRWTAEADELLIQLINERKSGTEAGEALSRKFRTEFTKGACISHARVLGYKFNSNHENNRRNAPKVKKVPLPAAPVDRPVKVKSPSAFVPPNWMALPESKRVSIVELGVNSCRWPLGDPLSDDFCFCGADGADMAADPPRPYCAAHAGIAFRPAQKRTITPEHRRAMLAGKISRHIHAVG